MIAGCDVFGGNPGEIAYVLRQYDVTVSNSCCEYGQVILPGKAEAANRAHLKARRFEMLRQSCRVHLVKK